MNIHLKKLMMRVVLDGYNDILLRLWQNATNGADPVAEFIEGTCRSHMS